MDLMTAITQRRSVRAFGQEPIDPAVLSQMIEAARVGPSAANRQPLEYLVVTDPETCQALYECLKWAAYIAPHGDPPPDGRPTAYVVVLRNQELELAAQAAYDVGAAIQTILLVAVAQGLGACWLRSVNVPRAGGLLGVPEGYTLDSVVALGRPAEQPVRVDLAPGDAGLEVIKYWRDQSGLHHVPKRALEAVLHWNRFGRRQPG